MARKLTGPALLGAAVVAGALLLPESASAQCSMCRTALEQNPEAAAGFNRAILLLLAAPYTVAASVAGYIVYTRHHRKNRNPSSRG